MSKALKDKSIQDLTAELAEKRGALRSFRFSVSGGKAGNATEGRTIKKDIARVLTELSARRAS